MRAYDGAVVNLPSAISTIHNFSPFVQVACTLSSEMKTKIAENIKFYRKQMGLTQEELAEKLFGKKSLISNYENGYSTPDVVTLCRLAKIFDVTLDELVEWNEET
jgi:ribosome-binding protein aMBF1 (putative translation factor)